MSCLPYLVTSLYEIRCEYWIAILFALCMLQALTSAWKTTPRPVNPAGSILQFCSVLRLAGSPPVAFISAGDNFGRNKIRLNSSAENLHLNFRELKYKAKLSRDLEADPWSQLGMIIYSVSYRRRSALCEHRLHQERSLPQFKLRRSTHHTSAQDDCWIDTADLKW